jgi:hypothetical protein
MFSVITNVYNKETEGPTLMELFTSTAKLKQIFWQLEMFDECTTGDTAHIDTLFKFLPHTRQHMSTYAPPLPAVKSIDAPMLTRVWQKLEYRIDVCSVTRGAFIERL